MLLGIDTPACVHAMQMQVRTLITAFTPHVGMLFIECTRAHLACGTPRHHHPRSGTCSMRGGLAHWQVLAYGHQQHVAHHSRAASSHCPWSATHWWAPSRRPRRGLQHQRGRLRASATCYSCSRERERTHTTEVCQSVLHGNLAHASCTSVCSCAAHQWFLIALSVRPGRRLLMVAHRLPSSAWLLTI